MAKKTLDFDRFLAEREDRTMTVRVFGRDCTVPVELPWIYMMKVENLIRSKTPIPGEENMALLKQMFQPDDLEYITHHPEFRASYVWELIAFAWLGAGAKEEAPAEPAFHTEDEMKIERTRANGPKKRGSAR